MVTPNHSHFSFINEDPEFQVTGDIFLNYYPKATLGFPVLRS